MFKHSSSVGRVAMAVKPRRVVPGSSRVEKRQIKVLSDPYLAHKAPLLWAKYRQESIASILADEGIMRHDGLTWSAGCWVESLEDFDGDGLHQLGVVTDSFVWGGKAAQRAKFRKQSGGLAVHSNIQASADRRTWRGMATHNRESPMHKFGNRSWTSRCHLWGTPVEPKVYKFPRTPYQELRAQLALGETDARLIFASKWTIPANFSPARFWFTLWTKNYAPVIFSSNWTTPASFSPAALLLTFWRTLHRSDAEVTFSSNWTTPADYSPAAFLHTLQAMRHQPQVMTTSAATPPTAPPAPPALVPPAAPPPAVPTLAPQAAASPAVPAPAPAPPAAAPLAAPAPAPAPAPKVAQETPAPEAEEPLPKPTPTLSPATAQPAAPIASAAQDIPMSEAKEPLPEQQLSPASSKRNEETAGPSEEEAEQRRRTHTRNARRAEAEEMPEREEQEVKVDASAEVMAGRKVSKGFKKSAKTGSASLAHLEDSTDPAVLLNPAYPEDCALPLDCTQKQCIQMWGSGLPEARGKDGELKRYWGFKAGRRKYFVRSQLVERERVDMDFDPAVKDLPEETSEDDEELNKPWTEEEKKYYNIK